MKRFIVVLIRDLWEDCGPQAGRWDAAAPW
jgi:hypothetical protein